MFNEIQWNPALGHPGHPDITDSFVGPDENLIHFLLN